MANTKQVFNPLTGNFDLISGIEVSNILFKAVINSSADFPTLTDVKNGWQYYVATPVTDNDPTKTNTGGTFSPGEYITWNGSNWSVVNALINWGSIRGLLEDQPDLKAALDSKLVNLNGLTTDNLSEGLVNKYLSGNEFNKSIDNSDSINVGTNNLFISATEKLKLANVTDYFKGYFIDEAALYSTFPIGNSGEYALVGGITGDTFFYWDETNDTWTDTGSTSTGDMQKSVYDPQNKNSDAFHMANMSEGANAKILTAAERTTIGQNTTDIGSLNLLKADKSNVLAKDNVEVYVPTEPTHPATKQYVDQNILSGGMLKYLYDPNNIEGDVFDMDNMIDGNVNKLLTIGAQNIQGVKTFIASPIVPTPTLGTQAVNKDYVDTKQNTVVKTDLFGNGQSRQNVTASRAIGSYYNNPSLTKPMHVKVCVTSTSASTVTASLGMTSDYPGTSSTASGQKMYIDFMVPLGASSYRINTGGGAYTLTSWWEFRE